MALKRWAWPGATLAAMALAAIFVLPPRTVTWDDRGFIVGPDYWYYGRGESVFERTLNATGRRLRERIEGRRRLDSILVASRRPGAMRTTDGLLTLVHGPRFSLDSASMWLRALRAELDAFPAAAVNGIPIVVAAYTDRSGREVDRAGYANWNFRRQLHQGDGRSTCVVEMNLAGRRKWFNPRGLLSRDSSGALRSRVLDWCVLYGRYGMPGERVARWSAGLLRSQSWGWVTHSLYENVAAARRHRPASAMIPEGSWYRLFSNDWEYAYLRQQTSYLVTGCVRGDRLLCLQKLRLTDERSPASAEPDLYWWGSRFAYLSTRGLIAHLLATERGDRFAAFWRSPLEPAAALAAAYGRPPGDLIVAWAQREWLPPHVGAYAPGRVLAAGLGWMVLALAVGMLTARWWKAEF